MSRTGSMTGMSLGLPLQILILMRTSLPPHRTTIWRSLLIVVVLACISPAAYGQYAGDFSIRLTVVSESFDMRDVVAWQEAEQSSLSRQIGVRGRILDSFPNRRGVRADGAYRVLPALRVTLQAGASSTGGRIYYSDYSGWYAFDQVATRYYLGGGADVRLLHSASAGLEWWTGAALRYVNTTLENELEVSVTDVAGSFDRVALDAGGFGIVPETGIEWHVWSTFLRAQVGYEFSLGNRLTYDGTPISVQTNDAPTVNWAGLRYGIGLGVRL
jgi:hypothetical protein